jgi:hypothetical protein
MTKRSHKTERRIAQLVEISKPYRWKPGQSGNPSGRPAVQRLSAAMRNILGQCVPGMNGMTFAEVIARSLAKRAAAGDVRAAEILRDTSEGRPTQSISLEVSQLAERFSTMSRDQLLAYAEHGELPEGMSDAEN